MDGAGLALDVYDLRLFTGLSDLPSRLQLSFALDQGELPPARVGLLAHLGVIGTGVPDLTAQGKITGLMLDTLGSLVPTGTRSAVGGEGGDMKISLSLDQKAMGLGGSVRTDQGHGYPVHVRGSFDALDINVGPVAAALATRFSGGAVNLTKNVTGAATDLGMGMTEGVEELGKGAAKALGAVGGGLLGTAKGLLTGDMKEAGEGLKQASAGAYVEAAAGAKKAETSATDRSKHSIKSVTGGARNAEWLAGIEARHAADMQAAKAALLEMTWPPRIEVPKP